MLPLTHFLISIGIGFALEVKFPNRYLTILLFGVVGVLPDLDHFIPGSDGMFHNLIVLGELPLALLIAAYILENHVNERSSRYQRFFTGVAVIMYAHLVLDLISGRAIGYGLSGSTFSLTSVPLLELADVGVIMASTDLGWLLLGILVLGGNFIQKKLYALTEEYYAQDEAAFRGEYPRRVPIIAAPSRAAKGLESGVL